CDVRSQGGGATTPTLTGYYHIVLENDRPDVVGRDSLTQVTAEEFAHAAIFAGALRKKNFGANCATGETDEVCATRLMNVMMGELRESRRQQAPGGKKNE